MGRRSEARHSFLEARRYAITVYVSNPFYDDPVVARLPFDLEVVEPLSGVAIVEVNGRMAAALKRLANDSQLTDPVLFEARWVGEWWTLEWKCILTM